MLNKVFLYLKNLSWPLFAAMMLLICFGLAEIYSIGLGQEEANLLYFKKQLIFVFVGLILFFVFVFLDYHFLRSFSSYIYLAGVFLLLAVLFFGETIRGTRGWFNWGGINFQPVELVKIILLVFLARGLAAFSLKVKPFKNILITAGGTLIYFILVALQPDFGSALILLICWLVLIMLAGFSKKYLAIIISVILVLASSGWFFYLKDYQKERVMTFFRPAYDPLDQGYNVSQAIIAVGAGGLTGRGLGFGSQSQLKFLPEAQNDFIFAVVAEELGLLGATLVILFFAIFFLQCLNSLKKIPDDFGIFFVLGAAILIFIQMFINISMNIGLLPVVGISLPFLSYGGSALAANLILVGIMENIIIKSRIK